MGARNHVLMVAALMQWIGSMVPCTYYSFCRLHMNLVLMVPALMQWIGILVPGTYPSI
jgi:hypothetical protein